MVFLNNNILVLILIHGLKIVLGGEKFEKNISASEKIKSWIGHHTNSLENNKKCKSLPENVMCQEVLHLDARALKIETKSIAWYFMYMEDVFKSTERIISGKKIKRFPKTNTWMGALYYKNNQNLSISGTTHVGVYI